MENNFFNLVKTRKTTYEFSAKKVKFPDIKKILEAARWSPSCSNNQPWHFIVIQNEKAISEIMNTAYYGDFHNNPALIIAVVLRMDCWTNSEHRCTKDGKPDIREAYLSVAMPSLIMCFQALELGIGSCLLTPTQTKICKLLKTPKEDFVPLIIGFGYEKKGAFQKPKERKHLEEIVFGEYFGGKIKI
jgi:nitroreductase